MKTFRKFFKIFIFILCFWIALAAHLSASINAVTTKINDEIDLELQKEILKIQKALFKGIKTKDYDDVQELLSPKLSGLKGFNLPSFINQVAPLLDQKDFVIADQYYSTIKSLRKEPKATIVPSLSDKTKFVINNLTFYGKQSYNLFLKSTNPGWQYLLFVSMGKFAGAWKINIIHFGHYSINYLPAPKLYSLCETAKSKNRLASCVVYSWAINKVLRPAPYLQYLDEKKYVKLIKASVSEMDSKIKYPFEIDNITIVGFQIETTNNEGLIPTISYLTELDLSRPEVQKQAQRLKNKILEKFYGLDHDFDYLLMRAYNEMPTDPKKKYTLHGTVIKLKEQQKDAP